MKWELGALKMLAKNPTVPGIALQDAIGEIERLKQKIKELQSQLSDYKELHTQDSNTMANMAQQLIQLTHDGTRPERKS